MKTEFVWTKTLQLRLFFENYSMNKSKINKLVSLLPKFNREAIGIELTKNSSKLIGCSKLGGAPDVSRDFVWPVDDKGFPLSLLLQINCSDIKNLNTDCHFPKEGHLYFFLDLYDLTYLTERNAVQVLYSDAPTSQLKRTDFPETLSAESRLLERSINFHNINSLPLDDDLANMNTGHCYSDYEELESAFSILDYKSADEAGFIGTMFGYAVPIQESVIDDFENDILLLQMFSFESADFQLLYGDWGSIYFTIAKTDLTSKQFSKVKFHMQCV